MLSKHILKRFCFVVNNQSHQQTKLLHISNSVEIQYMLVSLTY